MTDEYQRPPRTGTGLRLHLNENTNGCSPAVIDAIRRVGPETVAIYPEYDEVTAECAAALGVPPGQLMLTNGLDEGLLAAALISFRGSGGGREGVVIEPAFDMYAVCTDAAGGRVVTVAPRPDLEIPLDDVLAALSPDTRLVFLTNPNNPTGLPIPRPVIRRIAGATPEDALVFLDEAYGDFAGETFLDELDRYTNVVIGRTFAKAYGLAGIRVGAVIASPAMVRRLRAVVPPYSLNVLAIVALRAALGDRAYTQWYLQQVAESKRRLYSALDTWGLRYWRSAANFVLVHVGDRASDLVGRLAARGIFVRDRSSQPGCAGCVRITTGVVRHTDACIEALEAELCGAR